MFGINDIEFSMSRLCSLLHHFAYEERDITLSSGKKSNFYVDCRKVILTAEGHILVGRLFNHFIRKSCLMGVSAVGGMTLGADPLVSAVSLMSFLGGAPMDAFYIRKEAKKHGTGQYVEGCDVLKGTGANVVILEDVITTGGSALRAVDRAKEAGLTPLMVFVLVDRCEGGREVIEKHLPVMSLFLRDEIKSGEIDEKRSEGYKRVGLR
jgi:orotate phosphoribosyltransferase